MEFQAPAARGAKRMCGEPAQEKSWKIADRNWTLNVQTLGSTYRMDGYLTCSYRREDLPGTDRCVKDAVYSIRHGPISAAATLDARRGSSFTLLLLLLSESWKFDCGFLRWLLYFCPFTHLPLRALVLSLKVCEPQWVWIEYRRGALMVIKLIEIEPRNEGWMAPDCARFDRSSHTRCVALVRCSRAVRWSVGKQATELGWIALVYALICYGESVYTYAGDLWPRIHFSVVLLDCKFARDLFHTMFRICIVSCSWYVIYTQFAVNEVSSRERKCRMNN